MNWWLMIFAAIMKLAEGVLENKEKKHSNLIERFKLCVYSFSLKLFV